eukprot:6479382-Amphidinium_carterae.1
MDMQLFLLSVGLLNLMYLVRATNVLQNVTQKGLELGMQIEEPFSVLPQEKISNGIEASIMEATGARR